MKHLGFTPLRIVVAAVCQSLMLAGCVVGPNYQAPKPEQLMPQHVDASTALPAIPESQRWWTAFHDPALDELVNVALQHSPDLESADAHIRQARASLRQTAAQQLPQLNADGRVGHDQLSLASENFANIPFANPQSGFNDYRAGFDASWEIDLFGHTARSIEAARARLGSVEEQRADASLRIAAEIARNVLDYRYWRLRYDNAAAIQENHRELLHLAELQQRAGMAANSDVELAQANLHAARANLPQLHAAQQAALAALGPLTGLPQADIAALFAAPAAHPIPPAIAAASLPSELLLRRPDLRIAERQLAAASADIGVAVADQYPRFNLVGSGGWDSIHAGNLGENASRYWSFGPQFSLPLFSGGRLDAQVKAAQAARDAALADYRKAVLQALADVETQLVRCQGDRERWQKLQASQAAQVGQLAYARQRYRLGETAKVELLQANLLVANVNDAQLAAEQAYSEDLVALFKALGGSVGSGQASAQE